MAPRRRPDVPDYVDGCGVWFYVCIDCRELKEKGEYYFVQRAVGGGSLRKNPDKPSYSYRQRQCHRCRYLRREGHVDKRGIKNGAYGYSINGSVPVGRMQKYLNELEARCGGVRAAARRANVAYTSYMRWQGRTGHQFKHPVQFMHKQSAMTILQALREVRVETRGQIIFFSPTFKRRNSHRNRCPGCGCVQTEPDGEKNYTPGCFTCTDRYQKDKQAGRTPTRRGNVELGEVVATLRRFEKH